MTTLEERRHQADMVMVFKVLRGDKDVDKDVDEDTEAGSTAGTDPPSTGGCRGSRSTCSTKLPGFTSTPGRGLPS